jgi:dipeptidase E
MRLYLSSYLWGNHPEKILELIKDGPKKAALITNSADQFPEEGIAERFEQDRQFLATLGIESERLDLRDYFNAEKHQELKTLLKNFGFIWVRGANVFVLRRAMKQSGFDEIITEMLQDDSVVYGGFSAGACVMGNTLRGLELVDDAYITPAKYQSEVIWDGLNILPYAIAPHYKSPHRETELIDNAIQYFEDNKISYKALRDGEAIVVNGDLTEIVG